MSWVNGGSLTVTEDWSFTAPLPGGLFRLSHFCPGGYGRGLICQASFTLPNDVFQPVRLYVREERELFLFERPAPFDQRVIGVKSFYPVDQWIIFIEFWSETMPLFPDANSPISSTGTTTAVSAAITSAVLIAANSARKGLSIYNNSSLGTLYIIFGATASTTNFAERISPNTLWEMPLQYTGAIAGVWSAASGNAEITELT